ncbi:MAG: hypothetical protein U1C33_05580, partial [Candidatus Cloacimonadaceae bacterium]|nr:hypothetical protein [Candidatus Cloacimonadaceae bacterium]
MSIMNREFIKAINSGLCVVIVGSGPSNEMGLPTWNEIASRATDSMEKDKHKDAIFRCKYLLQDKKYPEVFSECEKVLGHKYLVSLVRDAYTCTAANGRSYQFLSSWPFLMYLTTNFDDCLEHHLRQAGV